MSILADHTSIPAQRAVEHPSWCDPLHCATTPDTDAELLVIHRAVLLDEQLVLGGRLSVEVVRGDSVCAHGGELLLPLAAAVARAAEIAGGAR